jgi:alpha-ketoglutarate-dependent taurine dioxygenase
MVLVNPYSISNQLNDQGFIFTREASRPAIEQVLNHLGSLVPHQRTNLWHNDLIPLTNERARPGSMSSFVGTGEQPSHTDGAHMLVPPRYLVFYCLDPGESPCHTNLWITSQKALLLSRPRILTEATWVFNDGVQDPFYAPITEARGGLVRVRFDPFCMCAAPSSCGTVSSAEVTLLSYTSFVRIEWSTSSMLIIDNWRCLHARGAGAALAPSRRLRRWTIGAQRGMAERFAL